MRVDEIVEEGDWVSLELPAELRGAALDALSGHVSRADRESGAGGRESWSVAVDLDPLAPEAHAELESILRGDHPGTLVSVLAEPPAKRAKETETRSRRRRSRAASGAAPSAARTAAASPR